MKNRYMLVILLLFAGAIVSCKKDEPQKIKVPSEMDIVDPEFRRFLIASFDTNVDFKLSGTEIWNVEKMLISNRSIRSLEGIEIFKNLKQCNISGVSIKSVDFTKNRALKHIGVEFDNSYPITIYLLESQRETCTLDYYDGTVTIVYL